MPVSRVADIHTTPTAQNKETSQQFLLKKNKKEHGRSVCSDKRALFERLSIKTKVETKNTHAPRQGQPPIDIHCLPFVE
jgi:hypothetical protein